MACKNCKGKKLAKKLQNDFDDTNQKFQSQLQERKDTLLKKNWDKSMGTFNWFEQLSLIFFGWIPLLIGYFYIIKFIISIF